MEKRLRMRTVAEGDAVEDHLTLADVDRPRPRPVSHAQRQHVHLDQIFHLVHTAL